MDIWVASTFWLYESCCWNTHVQGFVWDIHWQIYSESNFSTSSLALVIACLFVYSHPSWCVVVFHCGFDLHVSGGQWCWASFNVLICHLYFSFGEMSLPILWDLCNFLPFFLRKKFGRVFFFFFFLTVTSVAYRSSQARDHIGLYHSHQHHSTNTRLSCICDLCCSLWQHWLLNPLSRATSCILLDAMLGS